MKGNEIHTLRRCEDKPIRLLCSSANLAAKGPALVVVDASMEYEDYIPLVTRPQTTVFCTQYDAYKLFSRYSENVFFADISSKTFEEIVFETVFFRVSKSKAFTHYVISICGSFLGNGQALHLVGHKMEGIVTYCKKAAIYFGDNNPQLIKSSGSRVARIIKKWPSNCILPDNLPSDNYPILRKITIDGMEFYSMPGIYGWNKIDLGSQMLASLLPNLYGLRVLDLGCGYGYLSICAHQKGAAEIIATDCDVRAITACRRNFLEYNIKGTILPADCGDELKDLFDFIVCNPPFHQGFGTVGDLSDRFFHSIHRLLTAEGTCMIVANSFLPYEKKIRSLFRVCHSIKEMNGFKVFCLRR